MWPAPHSSVSRTSTTTAPLETCSRTTAGSTSSIRLLIWRRTSVPDGLIGKNSSNALWIQYFTEYSGLRVVGYPDTYRFRYLPDGPRAARLTTQRVGRP